MIHALRDFWEESEGHHAHCEQYTSVYGHTKTVFKTALDQAECMNLSKAVPDQNESYEGLKFSGQQRL